MTEFLWYSRLILWVGAIILLVEAVTGRSGGVITVAATLCLAAGFATFLVGLAVTDTGAETTSSGSPGIESTEAVQDNKRQSSGANQEVAPRGGPSKP